MSAYCVVDVAIGLAWLGLEFWSGMMQQSLSTILRLGVGYLRVLLVALQTVNTTVRLIQYDLNSSYS